MKRTSMRGFDVLSRKTVAHHQTPPDGYTFVEIDFRSTKAIVAIPDQIQPPLTAAVQCCFISAWGFWAGEGEAILQAAMHGELRLHNGKHGDFAFVPVPYFLQRFREGVSKDGHADQCALMEKRIVGAVTDAIRLTLGLPVSVKVEPSPTETGEEK